MLAPGPGILVVEVLDTFLGWVQGNKAARTYDWYKESLQRFSKRIPADLKVTDLKPYHVTRALEDFPNWSNNSKANFVGALKRAFNGAADEELIDRSPLARMKKASREVREMAVSPEEYARVVAAIKEPRFRGLTELSWETGARVQELRKIEARFLDMATGRIVFPPKQAKGKKYHRVIYLTARAKEILAGLAEAHPTGPILLNSDGKPWSKDAINCAFCRLQLALGRKAMEQAGVGDPRPSRFKKAGIEAGELEQARERHRKRVLKWQKDSVKLAREMGMKYHLGAFRKGYASEALKAGVDTVTLAHLLGHRDPSMVSRVYGQVQQDPIHMADAAKRAKGKAKATKEDGVEG